MVHFWYTQPLVSSSPRVHFWYTFEGLGIVLGLERERCSRAYCLGRLLRDALRRRVCPQRPLEGLAEVPRGSKAILDELPGTQNRSPEAHIGVEICWSGTTGIEHSAHAARFQPIVAILPPSS